MILWLKGGDLLVFGCGGEEFEFLCEYNLNVRVEVVSGIIAAAGVGSEFGILFMYCGVVMLVWLLIGYLCEGVGLCEDVMGVVSDLVDFAVTSVDVETTFVVYMGLGMFLKFSEKFIVSGFLVDMFVVVIECGMIVDEC